MAETNKNRFFEKMHMKRFSGLKRMNFWTFVNNFFFVKRNLSFELDADGDTKFINKFCWFDA